MPADAPHLPRLEGLAYRAGGPEDGPVAVCVHGWPSSSYMWRPTLAALAGVGVHGIAPDLAGFGESPVDRPGTWARHVEALGQFVDAAAPERDVALVVHDWGGLIGLRWACENPGRVSALVIASTTFFPDDEWHEFGRALRTPEQGEQVIRGFDRAGFGAVLQGISTGMDDEALDEYFRAFATDEGRLAQLDLYRSGELSELAAYEGALTALDVPARIVWGTGDPFLPSSLAARFAEVLPGSEVVLMDAGHFVADDAPGAFADEVAGFLGRVLGR
jgi:haloalkane dehalogenase